MHNRLQTQNKLIQATRQIIIESGIEAATLENICNLAGYTRGAFYSNFGTKDALLAALAEDEYGRLIANLSAQIEKWKQKTPTQILAEGAGEKAPNSVAEGRLGRAGINANADAGQASGAAFAEAKSSNTEGAGEKDADLDAALKEAKATEAPTSSGSALISDLLYEAIDALGYDPGLFLIHSELLTRAIRDPHWGAQMMELNSEFNDQLAAALEQILRAAGRKPTVSLPALAHSVIAIVTRSAAIDSWQDSLHRMGLTAQPPAGAKSGELGPKSQIAGEIVQMVLLLLDASSRPM